MGVGSRHAVDVRRDQILTVTVDLIDRIGLASVRVADVAGELGVSPALVFYHFGTKGALLAEAFEYAVDRDEDDLHRAVHSGGDATARMRRVLRVFGPSGSATGWRVWIDAWALAQRDPRLRKVLRRLDDRWTAAMEEVVRAGVEEGTFTCADPRSAVARCSALFDGLAVAALVYRSITRSEFRTWVAEAVAAEVGVPAHTLC
jgi:AcrR family transcriptional regulator